MALGMKAFADITGKTIVAIDAEEEGEEVRFAFSDGTKAMLYHDDDCCEYVRLCDIAGNLSDIIGAPILKAEESSCSGYDVQKNAHLVRVDEGGKPLCAGPVPPDEGDYDTFTWTFYHIVTRKGYVTLRWLGESNGYYSERVDFREVRE